MDKEAKIFFIDDLNFLGHESVCIGADSPKEAMEKYCNLKFKGKYIPIRNLSNTGRFYVRRHSKVYLYDIKEV